jgi:hypothetical protein
MGDLLVAFAVLIYKTKKSMGRRTSRAPREVFIRRDEADAAMSSTRGRIEVSRRRTYGLSLALILIMVVVGVPCRFLIPCRRLYL